MEKQKVQTSKKRHLVVQKFFILLCFVFSKMNKNFTLKILLRVPTAQIVHILFLTFRTEQMYLKQLILKCLTSNKHLQ